jgi:acyl-CoA thioesterase FadM
MSFKTSVTITFSQADMAGIAYFNQAFNIFHDQYEEFVHAKIGPKKDWFANPEWVVPIRHIESDYLRPLMAFETYDLTIEVVHTGDSSFRLETVFKKNDTEHCKISSTHVFIDKKTFKPRSIPAEILNKLKP